MYALVDCNNFFASCERVFNPTLIGKPLIVLSNNDGCIVSRSQEAKDLGIPMGAPAFQLRDFIEEHQVAVFSSNYTLYGDMSNRVMRTLQSFTEHLEIYSIDEAFLDLRGFTLTDLGAYGHRIIQTVQQHTGIPVSIGIAPTKALAKVANKLAKKYRGYQGVCLIDTEEKRIKALQHTVIQDVWGIGRQHSRKLQAVGIQTAYEFTLHPASWVRRHLTVTGERLWKELNGHSCLELELMPQPKKQICTSRSFGTPLTTFEELFEAVAHFTASCAAKLRRQHTCAGSIVVFIRTNPFNEQAPQYLNSTRLSLPVPTCDTVTLITYAKQLLKELYRPGFTYKKAGTILTDIIPDSPIQGKLFEIIDTSRQHRLLNTDDTLNERYGHDKVRIAAQGYGRKWKLKSERLSPCYTTNLEDIITINTD